MNCIKASVALSVQFTEEKLGQAEKTELDAHLENLLGRAEATRHWTEKVMRQTEVLLQPNPSEHMFTGLLGRAPSAVGVQNTFGPVWDQHD